MQDVGEPQSVRLSRFFVFLLPSDLLPRVLYTDGKSITFGIVR